MHAFLFSPQYTSHSPPVSLSWSDEQFRPLGSSFYALLQLAGTPTLKGQVPFSVPCSRKPSSSKEIKTFFNFTTPDQSPTHFDPYFIIFRRYTSRDAAIKSVSMRCVDGLFFLLTSGEHTVGNESIRGLGGYVFPILAGFTHM